MLKQSESNQTEDAEVIRVWFNTNIAMTSECTLSLFLLKTGLTFAGHFAAISNSVFLFVNFRIGYTIPMFVGFVIMTSSTVSK